MIELALQLLTLDKWYNVSTNIEIAKGRYEYVDSVKKGINRIKRETKWKK
jgi:Uri superfamily endonuclease